VIDAIEVMVEHHRQRSSTSGWSGCGVCDDAYWPCETYELAAQIEAVRKLHPRSPDGDFCETCYPAGWSPAWDEPTYPCPTAEALGVTKDATA
jgi:hypothetical protein